MKYGQLVRPLIVSSTISILAWGQQSRPTAAMHLTVAKGTVFRYEIGETTKMGAGEFLRETNSSRTVELKVLDSATDGSATLEYRVVSVSARFTGPGGSILEVDSSKPFPEKEHANDRLLRVLTLADLNRPLDVRLTSAAKIASIRGVDAIRTWVMSEQAGIQQSVQSFVEPWFTEDHYKALLGGLIWELPPGAAVAGGPWTPQLGVHYCPGLGGACKDLALVPRITIVNPSEVVVEAATVGGAQSRVNDTTISAALQIRLSPGDGLPIASLVEIQSVNQSPSIRESDRPSTTVKRTVTRIHARTETRPK